MTSIKATWTRAKETWDRISKVRIVRLGIDVYRSYSDTHCSQLAAGVALFAMISLLPMLIVMVSVLPRLIVPLFPRYDARVAILHLAGIGVSPVARRWL